MATFGLLLVFLPLDKVWPWALAWSYSVVQCFEIGSSHTVLKTIPPHPPSNHFKGLNPNHSACKKTCSFFKLWSHRGVSWQYHVTLLNLPFCTEKQCLGFRSSQIRSSLVFARMVRVRRKTRILYGRVFHHLSTYFQSEMRLNILEKKWPLSHGRKLQMAHFIFTCMI